MDLSLAATRIASSLQDPSAHPLVPGALPATAAHSAHFSAALAAPRAAAADATTAVAPVRAAQAASPVAAARPEDNLADRILDRMQSAGESYRQQTTVIQDTLNMPAAHFGVQQMLRVQYGINEVTMQIEIYTKGVAKLLQHVDQLTKLQ